MAVWRKVIVTVFHSNLSFSYVQYEYSFAFSVEVLKLLLAGNYDVKI